MGAPVPELEGLVVQSFWAQPHHACMDRRVAATLPGTTQVAGLKGAPLNASSPVIGVQHGALARAVHALAARVPSMPAPQQGSSSGASSMGSSGSAARADSSAAIQAGSSAQAAGQAGSSSSAEAGNAFVPQAWQRSRRQRSRRRMAARRTRLRHLLSGSSSSSGQGAQGSWDVQGQALLPIVWLDQPMQVRRVVWVEECGGGVVKGGKPWCICTFGHAQRPAATLPQALRVSILLWTLCHGTQVQDLSDEAKAVLAGWTRGCCALQWPWAEGACAEFLP